MSDFLSRLVQRTRGEAATVRPVAVVVTAPDSGASAWDERVIEHEAPLAMSPHAPSPPLLQRLHAATSLAVAPSAATARSAADEGVTEADQAAVVPVPAAHRPSRGAAWLDPLQDAAPAPHHVTPPSAELTPAKAAHAPLSPDARTALPGVASSRVDLGHPYVSATSPASASEGPVPTLTRAPAAELHAVDNGVVSDASTSRLRTGVTLVPPAPATPSSSELPAAAVRRSEPLAAEAPAARPERVAAVPTSPTPTLTRAAPRPALERLSPVESPARGDTSSVHEHSTTVEVSIGRIEVRLPPARGPVAIPTAPPTAPRRTAIGLDEYLQGRDTGKVR